MAKPLRTFVALEISDAVRQRTLQLIEQLRRAQVEVKWVEAENLHLTLKFLGDVDPLELPEVCRAVEKAAVGEAPFRMQLRGAGAFPSLDRPRILWLGVGVGNEQVSELFERIDQTLAEAGFAPESRKFHPHMTLGRIRRAFKGVSDLADLLRRRHDFEAGTCDVTQAVVFVSQLGRGGPRYEAVARLPLRGT